MKNAPSSDWPPVSVARAVAHELRVDWADHSLSTRRQVSPAGLHHCKMSSRLLCCRWWLATVCKHSIIVNVKNGKCRLPPGGGYWKGAAQQTSGYTSLKGFPKLSPQAPSDLASAAKQRACCCLDIFICPTYIGWELPAWHAQSSKSLQAFFNSRNLTATWTRWSSWSGDIHRKENPEKGQHS